jgi:hypothetical protein
MVALTLFEVLTTLSCLAISNQYSNVLFQNYLLYNELQRIYFKMTGRI